MENIYYSEVDKIVFLALENSDTMRGAFGYEASSDLLAEQLNGFAGAIGLEVAEVKTLLVANTHEKKRHIGILYAHVNEVPQPAFVLQNWTLKRWLNTI